MDNQIEMDKLLELLERAEKKIVVLKRENKDLHEIYTKSCITLKKVEAKAREGKALGVERAVRIIMDSDHGFFGIIPILKLEAAKIRKGEA